MAASTRTQVISLYRTMLRESQKFSSYNYSCLMAEVVFNYRSAEQRQVIVPLGSCSDVYFLRVSCFWKNSTFFINFSSFCLCVFVVMLQLCCVVARLCFRVSIQTHQWIGLK
uniref:Complex 1 LYR protein domain-containing protein n=1 Tax=Stegastes partitus TaxID=144197 RepID=A0A3B4YYI8_9TELE